jgi:hypothetical protein
VPLPGTYARGWRDRDRLDEAYVSDRHSSISPTAS